MKQNILIDLERRNVIFFGIEDSVLPRNEDIDLYIGLIFPSLRILEFEILES